MNKIRTISAAIGLAAVASLILGGCSATTANDTSAKPADSGKVTWWGYTPDTPVAQKYIAEFNKKYPKITVTYKNFENVDYRNTIIPALDSGKGPDVFDLSPAGGTPEQWGPYALDLTSLAKAQLGSDWESKIGEGYAKQLRDPKGRLVSMPMGGMSAGFLWANDNILKQAGADVPTDYASWVATCKKVAAIGKSCLAMGAGGADTFPTEMYHSIANSVDPSFFLKAATGKAKWSDSQGIKVLSIIKDMAKDGIISSDVLDAGQYPLANEKFMKGDAAFVQMGFWYTQYSGAESCKSAMEAAGVSNPTCFVQLPVTFPDVAGKGNGSQYFGEVDYGLAINSDSPNIGAAKTFVGWLTTSKSGQQDVANALDLLPSLQGTAPDWSNISLVDDAVQRPAIEKLIAESVTTKQTRQYQTTQESLNAIVVATQQVLDPSVKMSIDDIASQQQASSKASTVK